MRTVKTYSVYKKGYNMKKFISLTNRSIMPNSLGGAKLAAIFVLFTVTILLAKGTAPIFEGLGLFLGIGSFAISSAFFGKTTLLRVVPISYKKRVVYYYLDIVIFTLIGLIIFWLGFLVAMGVISLIILATTGENIFILENTEALINLSANAYLFSFFKLVLMFAVLSAIARIEKTKNFIVAVASYIAVYLGGSILLSNLVQTGEEGIVFRSAYYELFETLPLPWLAVVLCAVIAVGAAVGSVLFVINKEKPKEF